MAVMNVVCPQGATPGQQIPVQTPDGKMFNVQVPQGVQPGQQFTINIPDTVPVTAAVPPAGAAATAKPAPARNDSIEEDSRLEAAGQANNCCFATLSCLTLGFVLAMTISIDWWFSSDECYWVLVCCTGWCTSYCYQERCVGAWLSTRPITQDAFPRPVNNISGIGDLLDGEYLDTGGNGSPDFWSIIVGVSCAGFASLMTCCISCGPAGRRPVGPDKGIAACVSCASILNLVALICMGVQLMTKKNGDYVYNRFRFPPYIQLDDQSILGYWLDDRFYSFYGSMVLTAYIFIGLSTCYECCFFSLMTKGDKRLTRPSRGHPLPFRKKGGGDAAGVDRL